MTQNILTTARLQLKGISPALVHELATTKSKEELLAYFGFGEAGYAHFMSMHEKGMETFSTSLFYFVIAKKDNQEAIGDIGFHTWNAKHHRADLFYNIYNDGNKQKGFMSEALKEVITFGFREMNLHRITAMVANYNQPSLKLIKQNGFTFEGTLRQDYVVNGVHEDSDCYSLLKHEWKEG
jgi:ribosomal-protein-alanine N-acetyltransferase